jgi:hypothetical protein
MNELKMFTYSGFAIAGLLVGLLVLMVSCNPGKSYQVDVSDVEIDPIEIKRYEQVLFEIDPENLQEEIEPYVDDYYLFLGDEINTDMGQQQLYDYITDEFNREVYQDLIEQWGDLSSLEGELTDAFTYFSYHFPERNIPGIYSYLSAIDYEYPVFYQDGIAILALDMFLGKEYENYDRIGIPVFKRVKYIPDAVPVELMRTIAKDFIQQAGFPPESLLDYMIQEGKVLYFLDSMFPAYPDSLKIYYTKNHINWAVENEGPSWAYILENDMLYSSDRPMIQKFVGDSPFTAPFSASSAPRMGSFIGWMIIRNYMKRNPDITLAELIFAYKDSREILVESRYRPR